MKATYIQLQRRFVAFDELSGSEEAAWLNYYRPAYVRGDSFDWNALIDSSSPCIVVLGEAGSGKSWEFEAIAEFLNDAGAEAFYVPIDDLADREIEKCLAPPDAERLTRWLASDCRGVFLLDALDDARLRDRNALRKVIIALRRALGPAFERAQVVLSCRVSDWQADTDVGTLRSHFGGGTTAAEVSEEEEIFFLGKPRNAKPLSVRVVQLAPLDRKQLERFAKARGIEDVDEFLSAIDEADAWQFAGRPGDAEDLIRSWKDHKKLGSLTSLIQEDLTRKLLEAKRGDDPLELTKLRLAVERLAAAATLSQRNTFLLPDESHSKDGSEHSIDPSVVLPDFNADQRRAILARPIFDEATYGRVRFHHRTVREYLAASWFFRLIEKGCRSEVEEIFFKRKHGQTFIAPSLVPVAGWLATFDAEFRRRLFDVEPTALVQYGDPGSVDPAERAAQIVKLSAVLGERAPVWLEPSSLRRFADPQLAETISALLKKKDLPENLKYFLLLLVWHGHIVGCAPDALRIANDQSEDIEIRSLALRALGATADEAIRKSIGEQVLKSPSLPRSLAGSAFDLLYPSVFGVRELVKTIQQVPGGVTRSTESATFSLSQILSDRRRTPKKDLPLLLSNLLDLTTKPPRASQGGVELASERFAWLLEPLKVTVIRVFEEVPEMLRDPEHCRRFRHAYQLLQACAQFGLNYLLDVDALDSALAAHPEIRRAMFWDRIAEDGANTTHSYFFPGVPRLSKDDCDWLINDVADPRLSPEQRRVAFEASLIACSWVPEEEGPQLDRLRELAHRDTSLTQLLERALAERSSVREQRSLRDSEQNLAREKQRQEAIDYYQGELENIRSARNLWALHNLIGVAIRETKHSNFSRVRWQSIAAEYSNDIAEAAREGAIKLWRSYSPSFPHETTPNQTPGEVVIGLAGIAWEQESGLKVQALSDAEARHASRYALHELDGFPQWLDQLVDSHPEPVVETVAQALEAEFKGSDGRVFQHLSHATEKLQRHMAEKVVDLLKSGEPQQVDSLRYALSLAGVAGRNDDVADLAESRVRSLSKDRPRFMAWLAAWFEVRPELAIDFIEQMGPNESRSVIAELSSELGSRRMLANQSRSRGQTFFEPRVMKRLIPLVFQTGTQNAIVPGEPGLNAVSVAPPDSRFLRESLLQELSTMRGDEAYEVLCQLADSHGLKNLRERLLEAARKQASNDCEAIYEPQGIYLWEQNCLNDPQTADDLFRIAVRRLNDLKREIEQGDFSERDLFTPDVDEPILQKYIANRLDHAALNQYSVHREEEVDLEKKIDIRLWHPKKLVSTIEVKCANKWSYQELRDALEKQLVGRYLRSHKSKHGVLLLGHLGKRRFWRGPERQNLSFEGLVARLNQEADSIARENPEVASLAVCGIDFRRPDQTQESCHRPPPRKRLNKKAAGRRRKK